SRSSTRCREPSSLFCFSGRRRHTRSKRDWSSDVCSSDLLLTQIHPSLERALGPRLAHPAVVDLLGRYPSPAALQRAGRGHVRTQIGRASCRERGGRPVVPAASQTKLSRITWAPAHSHPSP